jgi:SAM-dependent methyltransferase
MSDRSNGYEALARDFILARSPLIGLATVRRWAQGLGGGAAILDLGCGHGVPLARGLREDGFVVYGVDASATLLAKFREGFPDAPTECGAAEEATLFGRTFDGVLAWGLLFLMRPEEQRRVIGKAAEALRAGGSFLFTAPREVLGWNDAMTGLRSESLGQAEYARVLAAHGFALVGHEVDEGENYYYFAVKQ